MVRGVWYSEEYLFNYDYNRIFESLKLDMVGSSMQYLFTMFIQ